MIKLLSVVRMLRVPLLTVSAFTAAYFCVAQNQSDKFTYPAHLPYRFANFVWWTDNQLRAELAKRVPGLGDEIATTHAAEAKMRDALTALLKEKGVVAEVQSEEPGPSAFIKPKGLFLGPQIQDQPHPAILFSILAPKIVNGKLTFQDVPQELNASLEQEVQGISGKPFTEQSNAFAQMRVIEMLNNLGYLDGDARLQREAPHKNGENWVVDLLLTVTAGPRYRVASLAVDGGPLLEGKDFSKFYALKAGEYSSRPPFGALGLQLRALYEHKGYADVEVEVAPSKNPAEARVSYRLTVKPGLLYHLRSLKIEHLNAEQEARVREIFGTKAGDVYDGSATTRVYHALPNEPLLHGLGFGFSPMPDRNAAAIDMTLSFYREGGEDTVTIK